mgnify:CR=1 FL=1
MKIIWITPECPYPPNSGGRSGIWNRIIQFSKNNEIFLFSIADEEDFKYINEINKYCKETKFYKRKKTLNTIIKSIFYPYTAVSRWNKDMKKNINKTIERVNPDFIIIDSPQMLGILNKKDLEKQNIVLCQHNIEYETLRNIANGIKNPIKKIIYYIVAKQLELYERKSYKKNRFALVTFVSISDKKYFEDKYKYTNTFLVPVGAYITDEINNNGKDVVFVAKMSYPPNEEAAIWYLENVWDNVYKENHSTKFYIVGKDPSENIKQLAKKHKNVIVTGTVESLKEYYDMAKIVVAPIFTGGGVNVKLLEALGNGKLVITTPKGIEGTDFEKNVQVLVCESTEEFICECNKILKNYDNYKDIVLNALNKMRNEYSWEKVVGKLEQELIKIKEQNNEE